MNITCEMAADLLPLYLENCCSEDSRAALEAHLAQCSACRADLDRMREPSPLPPVDQAAMLLQCRRKIRRRRWRIGLLTALGAFLGAVLLALCLLTVHDMSLRANPTVYPVESGVWNLTASDLKTSSQDAGGCILYTNYSQIKVTLDAPREGTVLLWNADSDASPILYGTIGAGEASCTFTGLSSSQRYRVTWDGDPDAVLTISEGREVSFGASFRSVLVDLLSLF